MDALSAQLLAKAVDDITSARNNVESLSLMAPITVDLIVQRLNQALTRLTVAEARLTGATTIEGRIVALQDGGECAMTRCGLPLVTITYDDGSSVTVHDDGSYDGHPAWTEARQAPS